MDTNPKFKRHGLLLGDLSYQAQGAIYNVANKYGKGLKENIYQKALAEELSNKKINFKEQERINIYSIDSGKVLGVYVPDFIVENALIIELKASDFTTKKDEQQQLSYLKASEFEVAYLVNFCTQKLYIKRMIYTNDRKPFISRLTHNNIRGN